MKQQRWLARSERWFRLLLRLYLRDFREESGRSMVETYRDQARDALKQSGVRGLAAVWMRALRDAGCSCYGEHAQPAGAWRYLEHDWISRAGDIVHETPGSVHTLVLQKDSEIISCRGLEYLDGEEHTLAHEDWRSITDKHVAFCAEQRLDVIDVARPRATHDRVAVA